MPEGLHGAGTVPEHSGPLQPRQRLIPEHVLQLAALKEMALHGVPSDVVISIVCCRAARRVVHQRNVVADIPLKVVAAVHVDPGVKLRGALDAGREGKQRTL